MSELRLSSGMPFGMLFIVVFLVGACTTGLVYAVRARGAARAVAAVVALLAGGRLVLGILSEVLVPVDLNPVVRAEELVGLWREGPQTLTLAADHTFHFDGSTTSQGRWSLDDWNLSLDGVDARVIKANGTYRIVVAFPHDPDLWDGRLGFTCDAAR